MALLIAGASIVPAMAQTASKPSSFAARLEQARTSLRVDAGGLSGPGAEILSLAIAKARYVLIGEDHMSREIPLFTSGICRLMAPGGLDAFAVEIGPEAARVVNGDLRRPDRVARISSFLQAHPDAFAFQNGQDESDMAAGCAALAGPNFQLWGLDQEFFGASGHLLERMIEARPGPSARAAIGKLAALDRTATAEALGTGSPGDLLVFKITDQQMAEARTAIRRDGGPRVNALFDSLAETRAIYLSQNSDGFASNGQRAQLMKQTLLHYLDARRKPARMLFKFGDVHMAKGVNGLGQRDLGNFVAERADGEGAASLHIAVYGAKGVHAFYGGVGRQVRHEPFIMSDDADYAWLKTAVPPGFGSGARNDWMLLDLRRLRGRLPASVDAQWRDLVDSYDLLVVAPELTPSTLLGTK
ncbi:hypothetical protein [Sphingomonas rustica]